MRCTYCSREFIILMPEVPYLRASSDLASALSLTGCNLIWLEICNGSLFNEAQENFLVCGKGEAGFARH
jgi:hypothetical protein